MTSIPIIRGYHLEGEPEPAGTSTVYVRSEATGRCLELTLPQKAKKENDGKVRTYALKLFEPEYEVKYIEDEKAILSKVEEVRRKNPKCTSLVCPQLHLPRRHCMFQPHTMLQCAFYEYHVVDEHRFFVFEFCDGGDMFDARRNRGSFPKATVRRFAK